MKKSALVSWLDMTHYVYLNRTILSYAKYRGREAYMHTYIQAGISHNRPRMEFRKSFASSAAGSCQPPLCPAPPLLSVRRDLQRFRRKLAVIMGRRMRITLLGRFTICRGPPPPRSV